MSKISTALRAAALGPAPIEPSLLGEWVSDNGAFARASWYVDMMSHNAYRYFDGLTEDECRIFLLLVAEAEE